MVRLETDKITEELQAIEQVCKHTHPACCRRQSATEAFVNQIS